jgi:hypothetical protein
MDRDDGGTAIPIDDPAGGTAGYHWTGELAAALEEVDATLAAVLAGDGAPTVHTCTPLLDRVILEKLGYFARLPALPMYAVPHTPAGGAAPDRRWVLSPSICFQTLGRIARGRRVGDLEQYAARGACHRAESGAHGDPLRLSSFTMREIVFAGDPDRVRAESLAAFERLRRHLDASLEKVTVGDASDVFYGADAQTLRRMQTALSVKRELSVAWGGGRSVSVASWNDHRGRLTEAFGIRRADPSLPCRSACVGFGLERIAVVLLASRRGLAPQTFLDRITAKP